MHVPVKGARSGVGFGMMYDRQQQQQQQQDEIMVNGDDAISLADRSLRLSVAEMNGDDEESDSVDNNAPQRLVRNETRAIFYLKFVVMLMLVTTCIVMSYITYELTRRQQFNRFDDAFEHSAEEVIASFYRQVGNQVWGAFTVSTIFSMTERGSLLLSFPQVVVPGFDAIAFGQLQLSRSSSMTFAPLVKDREELMEWETFAVLAKSFLNYNEPPATNSSDAWQGQRLEDGVFEFVDGVPTSVFQGNRQGPFYPAFQVAQGRKTRKAMMLDMFSEPNRKYALNVLLESRSGSLSPTLDEDYEARLLDDGEKYDGPKSIYFSPIFKLNETGRGEIVGAIGSEIKWVDLFETESIEGANHVFHVVTRNSCSEGVHTFEVRNGKVSFIGAGDLHDPVFDGRLEKSSTPGGPTEYWANRLQQTSTRDDLLDITGGGIAIRPDDEDPNATYPICRPSIRVYPTEELRRIYVTNEPFMYTLGVTLLVVFVGFIFLGYNCLVERRQNMIMDKAVKNSEIVSSLFPKVIRDRLFGARQETGRHSRGRYRTRGSMLNYKLPFDYQSNGSSDGENESGWNNNAPAAPKVRLTTFLQQRVGAEEQALKEEPIAEMFPSTTVIFADIVGFTAWSSQREPTQVFSLLETLYSAFDVVAKRLNVFKVETIGDCYVAVTGLPTPHKDHAVVMARFAYEIMQQMLELTKNLEITLGPGTSDLGVRIGLHSGAVTAGVLRGEKSRFQLFGDTMNTASRMESTGNRNKIQVSQATADLIVRAGKQHWLTPREGQVMAKGKGHMQTYWLQPQPRRRENSNLPPTTVVATVHPTPSHHLPLDIQVEREREFSRRECGSVPEDGVAVDVSMELETEKLERLIDWNVEILLVRLSKLVETRAHNSPRRPFRSSNRSNSAAFSESLWSVDGESQILSEVSDVISLPKFDPRSVFRRQASSSRRKMFISNTVKAQLREFVSSIASQYRNVPFHNFEHASHVALSANKMIKRIITDHKGYGGSIRSFENGKSSGNINNNSSSNGNNNNNNRADLSAQHYSTFGISSDPLTQFAVVFAALIHDVDHRGVPNVQLVREKADVAIKFGDKSVAEQQSVDLALRLLAEPRFKDLQLCVCETEQEQRRFRQLLINLVMATDIADKELHLLRKARWQKAFEDSFSSSLGDEYENGLAKHHHPFVVNDNNNDDDEVSVLSTDDRSICLTDELVNRKATVVIEHIIQASDVAHTMQHWHVFCKWNERLFREMRAAYRCGRAERDPLDGWYESELAFFDHYIVPLAKQLKECGVFGVSSDECLTFALENRNEWKQKGQQVCQAMAKRYGPSSSSSSGS